MDNNHITYNNNTAPNIWCLFKKRISYVDPLSRGYTVRSQQILFHRIVLVRLNAKLPKLKWTDTIKINGKKMRELCL